MSVFFTILTFLFILVSVALVLVILVQRPQGGGLASAFGGGGGTDTAFGGRTGDALTVGTVSVFAVYLLLAMALNIFDPQTTLTSATPPVTEQPAATMPASDGSGAPVTTVPMTPVAAPQSSTSTVPTTPVAAPTTAPDAGASQAAVAPTSAPAAVPPTTPEKPQQL